MSIAKHKLEVQIIDFVAKRIWPFVRPFLSKTLSRRCKTCVLPETYVELDQNGICTYCIEASVRRASDSNHKGRIDGLSNDLHKILDGAQGTGVKYDALLLFSGGKDSSFMLHKISKEYPRLKILALMVDNGFMSPVALKNASHVLKKFDVDFLSYHPKPSFVQKSFKLAMENIPKQKGYSVVDLVDGQITFDAARNMAAVNDIPLILCGLSRPQVENVFGEIGFEFLQIHEENPLVTQVGLRLENCFTEDELTYWFDRSNFGEKQAPRFLLPFLAWDPTEQFVLEEVERLGLIEAGQTSPLLTNNALIPIISIAETNHFGCTSFEVEFSKIVREGRIERAYWLNLFQLVEYSAKTGRFLGGTIDEVLSRLELTRDVIGLK